MTQEEKQHLLIDLCARLPYKVKGIYARTDIKNLSICEITTHLYGEMEESFNGKGKYEFIPYLRPMSSMTEEEKEELKHEHVKDEKLYAECLTKAADGDNSMRGKVIPHFAADWCNKNHFDYRGLIPMGLALEALKGMYNSTNNA